jgi:pimeloyl-ACP methyl ester carboxylesterase
MLGSLQLPFQSGIRGPQTDCVLSLLPRLAEPRTEALIADGEEPGANSRVANLGASNSAYLVLLVPGLG